MDHRLVFRFWLGWSVVCSLLAVGTAARAVEIQSICRLKGQEPYWVRGLGLVTGLSGTGDSRLTPMHRAVQQVLTTQGLTVLNPAELTAVRNVALVQVSCEIPGTGVREGTKLDCFVSSIGTARSLGGGRLLLTSLNGPVTADDNAFAMAEGALSIEDPNNPNHARIEDGVRIVMELPAPFLLCEDSITLVIDKAHASFVTAQKIAQEINRTFQPQLQSQAAGGGKLAADIQRIQAKVPGDGRIIRIAYAVDAQNVEVLVPEFFRGQEVAFVADVMEIPVFLPNTEARVIINERTGTLVVTGEVEVTPVLVSHGNLLLFPGAAQAGAPGLAAGAANPLAPLTPTDPPFANQPELANLNDLLIALNRAQVSSADKIAIIKELAKSGKLHAKVVYE